jgi:hypothetical protein
MPDRWVSGDLVEREGDDVVQDERHPLSRRHRLEHDQQRGAHRLIERDPVERLVRAQAPAWGVAGEQVARNRFGKPLPDVPFAAGASAVQQVQADATRHARELPRGVRDGRPFGVVEPVPPQVRLLHGVLRLTDRAQHPVRQPHQPLAFTVHDMRVRVAPLTNHRNVRQPEPGAAVVVG